jgi:hypothetical protein
MKFAVVVAAIALISGGVYAHQKNKAPMKGNDKAMFAAMYAQAANAFDHKDIKGLSGGMTSDFTETAMGKTMNRADSLKGLKQFIGMFATIHCKFDMKSCTVNGNTATTMDSVHLWGTTAMDKKTHKAGKLDATRDETFTWTKSKGRWWVKSIVASNEKMLLNGKPMPMGPPGK